MVRDIYQKIKNLSKNKKLIYVELRYDDGNITFLKGKDAEDWKKDLDAVIFIGFTHGVKMKEKYNWKTKKK